MDAVTGMDRTLFRSYMDEYFMEMPGWTQVKRILTGNGGAYGLYGPRGSGKSWLMHRAISEVRKKGGTGLWFPCPSEYTDAAEFLSALSDNLANAVEQHFLRDAGWRPRARPQRRLAGQATALRERIKYTAVLHQAAQATLSGGYHATGSLQVSRGRDLNERPTTIASLVFDFRRLAEAVAATMGKPLVIGIDELDKISDPEQARKLLRDIKSIFEIPDVLFLVSVSEEAATALGLGALQGDGRNEFNSSFYTVVELGPLTPEAVANLMAARGHPIQPELAGLLCLLSAGNLRELIRLAERWQDPSKPAGLQMSYGDKDLVMGILDEELESLRREIVRVCGSTANQVLLEAWKAIPGDGFGVSDVFGDWAPSVIHEFWDVNKEDSAWKDNLAESWRRFLIRLFVIKRACQMIDDNQNVPIRDLRDVLIMAGRSTSVARDMLEHRFGPQLDSRHYNSPRARGT
jgi:hypothetical protein